MKGKCYLVGAGPGDPGLITVKGRECLERAEVLIYDALSSPEFLRWAPEDCEKIYAGKRAREHALSQDEINALMIEKGREGRRVVRLKGGDPLIFGRGGEEAAALAAAGVPFEIVPGISSAVGGAAYAGIPVTHRAYGSQLTIFTGHEDPGKVGGSLDYGKLARADGTKVFLMGMSRLREITDEFLRNGADPKTPVALVQWATTGRQRTVEGTLDTIADLAGKEGIKAPAVGVIGEVVRERAKIAWFESRPLFGRRVVVTRTREQAGELSAALRGLGAEVVELPTIRIEDPEDKRGFAELVRDSHRYDWLVFTSPNGVRRFFEGLFSIYPDARSLGGARIAAIGPGTAKMIAEYRIGTDLMPKRYVAEGLVEAFAEQNIENQTVLWVKAAETRDVIFEELTRQGAIVDQCIAYRTVPETRDPTGAAALLRDEGADLVTFTSSSTVENFFRLGLPWPEGCRAASIGPITSEALRAHGHPPEIEATRHDIPGLVEAIVEGS